MEQIEYNLEKIKNQNKSVIRAANENTLNSQKGRIKAVDVVYHSVQPQSLTEKEKPHAVKSKRPDMFNTNIKPIQETDP